jgi:hypothetical protein
VPFTIRCASLEATLVVKHGVDATLRLIGPDGQTIADSRPNPSQVRAAHLPPGQYTYRVIASVAAATDFFIQSRQRR